MGTDLSGEVLDGRYQVIERMAEGAMGIVYRGVRTKLNRPVAIKVMHAALPAAMAARERFEREAKLMALLEHPHCVSVIDFGLHDDKPFVVMELVRGRSLHDLIVEQGRFEIPRGTDIVRQVLSGLSHAHEQGIIHRDIKPANIMITPKAPLGVHVRILDFGLARLCGSNTSLTAGVAVGTPSYMAPEQCRGDALDERVDLYACGVVLFELLTGRKPFVADDPIKIVRLQLDQPPPRLSDVANADFGALEDVVARALAKWPAERYATAAAMSEAIDAATGGRSTAEPTSAFHEDDLRPPSSSVQVPITIDSAAFAPSASEAKTGVHDPHDKSILRRMLPVSRLRWVVLACLVIVAAGGYSVYALFFDDKPEPPAHAAATEPGDAAEIEMGAVAVHPKAANDAYDAGLGYFARLWWTDGIKSLRHAIELDPSYRDDPALLAAAARGFVTTPSYDDRLGSFMVWLGPPVVPQLEELARTSANPEIRARCAAMVRRLKR